MPDISCFHPASGIRHQGSARNDSRIITNNDFRDSSPYGARKISERRHPAISTEVTAYLVKALEAEVKGFSLPREPLPILE